MSIVERAKSKAFSWANKQILPYVESALIDEKPGGSSGKPIFLLGPPRSGSTLIMQVLTDAFNFSYLSNTHCVWFGAPALAERLFEPLAGKAPSCYVSSYGRTKGKDAPAECGGWWYRFFPRERPYVALKDVSESRMRDFVESLNRFGAVARRPLIFKNLYASLRIEPISYYVPNALFVVIQRDWVDNAQSILKGRYDALGDYNHWWSVPPPNVEELAELSLVEQVVGQVSSIHDLINGDIQRLNLEERTFRIRYEDFCNDVHGTVEAFRAFALKNGLDLGHRFDVPAQFPVVNERKIPRAMYRELKASVIDSQYENNVDEEVGE